MLCATSVLLAVAAVGVQFGSEPLKEGGNTYIVQVEPELIDSFRKEGFSSDVPPQLRDIRRIEIRVGTAPLPNQGLTVLKPIENGTSAAAKRQDASPPDTARKKVAPSDEPKIASSQSAPRELPSKAPTDRLTDSPAKTVEQASFKPDKRSAVPADGGPSAAGTPPDSQYGKQPDQNSGQSSETDRAAAHDPEKSSIPFLGALGALILSGAGNLYLGWVHLGTRRRYREVVGQLRETDLPIAVEPLE
jgi:hypothetical protein